MKRKSFTTAVFIMLASLSYISAQQVTEASLTNFEATSLSTQPKMFGVPLVAEVNIIPNAQHTFSMEADVNLPERVSKESDNSYLKRVNTYIKERLEEIKTEAIFNFSEQADADVIVSPAFSITTLSNKGLYLKMKVKVRGYPAKYTNFRNLTDKDSTIVKLSQSIGSSNENIINIGSTEYERNIEVEKSN